MELVDKRVPFQRWKLSRDSYELYLVEDGYDMSVYEVDLEECVSSAEVLDWIMQISKKLWATPEVLADLVVSLDFVLNPQATLCSDGRDKRLTPAEIRDLVERVPESLSPYL